MGTKEDHLPESGKKMAAVCGLYCDACSVFIATKEDPDRLGKIASRFGLSAEETRCHGCRSEKRLTYCEKCTMYSCASEKGIDFCGECGDYPCDDLKKFQSAMPHRIELWKDLERIRTVGYEKWLGEAREKYTCPACYTINSAYDLKCRKCGHDPSCRYVEKHKEEIRRHLGKAG